MDRFPIRRQPFAGTAGPKIYKEAQVTRFGTLNARGLGGRLVVLLLAAVALIALAAPAGADAKKKKKKVTVMTRNLYLGADLTPGLEAKSFPELFDAAGEIANQVDRTNFPVRAGALAKEIKKRKPDLVGMQEVALWRTAPTSLDVFPPKATTVEYDFLDLLLDKLNGSGKKKKLKYKAVVEKPEFDFETPINDDGSPGPDHNERLTMRDVILAKKGVKTSHETSGTFDTLLRVSVAGLPVDVTRGWTAVDAKVRGKKFHFVNTHLEAFDSEGNNDTNKGTKVGRGEIRAAQASELVGAGGPAQSGKPVVLLGDLNSDDDTVQPNGDRDAYNAVVAGGFTEVSTANPLSCCLSDPNLVGGSLADFDHQVDHVLTDNPKKFKFKKGFVTGLAKVNGLWPSDHAGVTSVLKGKK
jgi:endonuclease/exonuclease/phosphatase family metal-dependent hydrolase